MWSLDGKDTLFMTVLLTGAAGFIGSQVSRALLAEGRAVIGLDDLNDYYDPALKRARLAFLETQPGFSFLQTDIADRTTVLPLAERYPEITLIVHLAAQAGVIHDASPFASSSRHSTPGHVEFAHRQP